VRFGARFRFALPAAAAGRATFTVLDPGGRRVRTFSGPFAAGVNEIAWDGLDGDGRPVRSGLYFYELAMPGGKLSHRLVVVR
jgi:flagellar hook assembly protein FlgD